MSSSPKLPASHDSPEIIGQIDAEMSLSPLLPNQDSATLPPEYCGHVLCFWVPECSLPANLYRIPSHTENQTPGSGQTVLEESHTLELNAFPPTSPIDSLSSILSPITVDTLSLVTQSPMTESGGNTPLPPSPTSSLPSPPYFSDTGMIYDTANRQINPFTAVSPFYEPWERINHIVVNDQVEESIKESEDILIFLIEHLLPSSPKGKGSRGGVEYYSCAFPGCTDICERKDRGIDHILNHFGAKPYRCEFCPLKFLRKADLNRHGVRNGTCPGNGQEHSVPKKGKSKRAKRP